MEDEVYAVTKAIVDTTTPTKMLHRSWSVGKSRTPARSQWMLHFTTAQRLLKERSVWTPEPRNGKTTYVKRHATLRSAWADMMAKDPAAKGADAASSVSFGCRDVRKS